MSRFQFRFAALLKYRENLRDQCRQVLAQWLARDADLVAEQQRRFDEREQLLSEMRIAQQFGQPLDIEKLATRRYRAGQLSAEIQEFALRRREIAEQISLCRQALVKADQGVKVLEQLRDQQLAVFQQADERRVSREREEIWQAARLRRN